MTWFHKDALKPECAEYPTSSLDLSQHVTGSLPLPL